MSIGVVARRTGLTERALRYYEQRGLVRPARSANGRRVYADSDLARLGHVVLLGRMGFSLSRIGQLLRAGNFDAGTLVDLQIETCERDRGRIDEILRVLRTARENLGRDRQLDMEALCELIRMGESKMNDEAWEKIYRRYFTAEEREHWRNQAEQLPADFDQEAYNRQWTELDGRIRAALPLDPRSELAGIFLDQWNALLEPFLEAADGTMLETAGRLWSRQREWEGEVASPVSRETWDFIGAVQRARDGVS